jgi:hypothetical protein
MCVELVIKRRGRPAVMVFGVPELRRLLGWRPPILPGYGHTDMNKPGCLCPVDLDRLARLAGWTYTPPDYDTGRAHSFEHLMVEAGDG